MINGGERAYRGRFGVGGTRPRHRRRASGRRSRHHGRSGRQDRAGLQLQRTRCASGCSSRSPASTRSRRRHRPRRDRHHPPEGVRAEPEGAGDHRRQPVLHVARPRQRDAVHPHDRRRRARQVPALLRQLLRPARLRRDPRALGRHRVLDRLPAARRPRRRRRLQGRRSTGSRAACPATRRRRRHLGRAPTGPTARTR